MRIKFDFEGREEESAFFALYAGLRMYKENKESQLQLLKASGSRHRGDMFSIPAAEAFCMLEDLKKQHPRFYKEAEDEFNEVYG